MEDVRCKRADGCRLSSFFLNTNDTNYMSKNGKSSLTPKAKEAAERFSAKAFAKALRLDKFGPQMETKVADMCREAWAAGYFYAKQESEL